MAVINNINKQYLCVLLRASAIGKEEKQLASKVSSARPAADLIPSFSY
jgi:hypothetical protein